MFFTPFFVDENRSRQQKNVSTWPFLRLKFAVRLKIAPRQLETFSLSN